MSADATPTNETLESPPLVLAPGVVLCERFRLDRVIASGGYGDVWSGFDLENQDKRVAIKILRNDAGNNDPSAIARMRMEAEILERLRHPNIVQVFGFFESPYGHFLAMELLDGHAIDQAIQLEGPAPHDRVVVCTRQILSALEAAHEQDVLHRDIKPENILLTKSPGGLEVAKLLDFGIAKARRARDDESGVTLVQTRAGGFMGTPRYASPEQAVGDPLGPSSDLFALGLVVAEWLTGKVRLDGERYADVMQQLLDGSPVPLADVPARWQQWLKICLHKTPERRFQTALDASHALEDLVVNFKPTDNFVENRSYFAAPPSAGVTNFVGKAGPLELDLDRVRGTAPPHIPITNTPARPLQHTPQAFQNTNYNPTFAAPPAPSNTQRPPRLTWVDYVWAWAIFMFIGVLAIVGLSWALKYYL